ncbi:MAG: response regulator [Anaerovoracaceae bacterium]
MTKPAAFKTDNGNFKWLLFYTVIFIVIAVICISTAVWIHNSQNASEQTINDLCEFYLEEITERNTANIISELEKNTKQMQMAIEVLNQDYLSSEAGIREYTGMVQQINGLDMFALIDDNGMVYTADSTFSGISRFPFLSEEITETRIQLVNSFGTKTMVLIAEPVELASPSEIRIVSCLTGVNIEKIISAVQLQSEENKTYCRLFNKDGTNLINIKGDYPNGQNLFDVYSEGTVFAEGYSLEKMKEDWSSGTEGYAVYSRKNSGNTYMYYKNVPGTDLMLTSLMRESNISQVVNSGTRKMMGASTVFMVCVIIALLGLFLVIVAAAQDAKKKQDENDQFKILDTLSNEFSDVYLVELGKDAACALKISGKMTDYKKTEALSYHEMWKEYAEKYITEEDAERVLAEVAEDRMISRISETSEYSVDYHIKLPDGVHNHQTRFVKIVGEENRVIAGFRNIDLQVKAEMERQQVLQNALLAAQHANRAKTTFLNNMSHDIRTPMNAIIGFTSLAAVHVDKPEQVRDYLTKIQTASSHLMSLINDVLDMSRIESGKVKIEEKEVNLPDMIHDLRTIVQSDINAKQLEFYIDAVDVRNENVICDRLRLNQILLNLLSNAMKFTKPGGFVSLRIVQKPDARKGYAEYEFRVKDSGIGISKEFQEHIFEAFTREQNSTVSGIQGTGLGLAITKSIVDIIGGTIEVSSEEGKGSEFTVNLPLRISGSPVRNEAIPELKGLRALVADDDVNTCMSISSMLNVIGMRSEWTTFGKEAVIRARFAIEQKDEFHAYIIDWLMPDMNGIEVVRRIRRIIGDSKPIIILTAYDWTSIEDEAKEAGVTAFASKPLFMSELRDLLTKPFAKNEAAEPEEKKSTGFEGKKILLVEDNELNQEIAVELLKIMGFSVECAMDGEEAVEIMRNAVPGRYDLILMDIQMPHMNGYEATRQIRKLQDPLLADIPIIAMTANAFEEDRQLAFDAGMNGHISKPIETDALVEALKNIFDPSR